MTNLGCHYIPKTKGQYIYAKSGGTIGYTIPGYCHTLKALLRGLFNLLLSPRDSCK